MPPASSSRKSNAGTMSLPTTWRNNGWSWWHVTRGVVLTALTLYATRDAGAAALRDGARNGALLPVLAAPLGAAWLGWVRRARLQAARASHGLPGAGLYLIALIVYGLSSGSEDAAASTSGPRIGVALAVLGLAGAYLGTAAWTAFLPVAALLGTLVPAVWLTSVGGPGSIPAAAGLLAGQGVLAWAYTHAPSPGGGAWGRVLWGWAAVGLAVAAGQASAVWGPDVAGWPIVAVGGAAAVAGLCAWCGARVARRAR